MNIRHYAVFDGPIERCFNFITEESQYMLDYLFIIFLLASLSIKNDLHLVFIVNIKGLHAWDGPLILPLCSSTLFLLYLHISDAYLKDQLVSILIRGRVDESENRGGLGV